MSLTPCPQENTIARAARTGLWDESLRQHARECKLCAEVFTVAQCLRELAGSAETSATSGAASGAASGVASGAAGGALPDASLLWWKHELMRRYARSERARRPIQIMELISGGLALWVIAVTLAISAAGALEFAADSLLPRVLASALSGQFGIAGWGTLSLMAAAIGAGLLYPLWREH